MLTKFLLVPIAIGYLVTVSAAIAFDSASPQKSSPLADAQRAINMGNYEKAIPMLEDIVKSDTDNADAFNLLAYSQRKIGDYDAALGNYQKALSIDPEHRGANEYLGELYLTLDNLPAAEERLKVLDDACGLFGCKEEDELEEAIEAYKKANGIS